MMKKLLILAASLAFVPSIAAAAPAPASFTAARTVTATDASPGNAYAAGMSVVVTAPVKGDLSALGGSVITAAPVEGDDLLLAGSIDSRAPVAGDLRALGGSVSVGNPVGGDLVALGLSVDDEGEAGGSVFVVAANATLDGGAKGPVTVYANNVALAGTFAGDVTVYAGGRVALAPGTVIRGKLSYESPELASIPASVKIEGGIAYTNASYLPNVGTSRTLALVSLGFFLVARIIGALILAGLFAGLFPAFAKTVINSIYADRFRDILLATLLGFAITVATPLVGILLSLTFVGFGVALVLGVFYALLLLLALIYAGIVMGGMFARRFVRRERVVWSDGVIGMLLLSLLTLVPFVGLPLAALLTFFCAGTLLQIFFRFAFPRDEEPEDLSA